MRPDQREALEDLTVREILDYLTARTDAIVCCYVPIGDLRHGVNTVHFVAGNPLICISLASLLHHTLHHTTPTHRTDVP